MAASPIWKVYDSGGIYQAACKDVAAAAVLVTWYGFSSTIRYGHTDIVWHEGHDGIAPDSFDQTELTIMERVKI